MFSAKPISKIEYSPGKWGGEKIGVFRDDEQIGEYDRNYDTLYNTFAAFHQNGKDLALYSSDYTATRIMELPSCKDIGGEEPNAGGFCPVDYFVPTYIDQERRYRVAGNPDEVKVRRINNPKENDLLESTSKEVMHNSVKNKLEEAELRIRPITPTSYYPFGFVAGCLWGDDGSWKIQYLDLSEADKGLIKRDERFGYIELPPGMGLKDAIYMNNYGRVFGDSTYTNIRINIVQRYDLRTGEIPDPWD